MTKMRGEAFASSLLYIPERSDGMHKAPSVLEEDEGENEKEVIWSA